MILGAFWYVDDFASADLTLVDVLPCLVVFLDNDVSARGNGLRLLWRGALGVLYDVGNRCLYCCTLSCSPEDISTVFEPFVGCVVI